MRSAGHLNKTRIAELEPRTGRQYVLWDHELPGFGIRVSPGGTKTYIVKYRLATGRVRWKTIARVGVLPLEKARKRARRDLGLVADDQDPLRTRDVARDADSFGEIAARFLTEHVDVRLKASTRRNYHRTIERLRVRFGTTPIADVSPADVAKLHRRLRATPYEANRTISVLSKLINWARREGLPIQSNPCEGLEKHREQARQRYLTPEELKRLGAALRIGERFHRLPPSASTAIRLLLLTGARVSEILSLRWAHVDLEAGELRLADSKTGRKTIRLNAPACDLLREWPHWAGSPYVFPGEGRGERKGEHRVTLTDAWAWVRRRAKIADVRLHDLRHSFASVAVSSGHSLPIVGALLGHSQAQTTMRYAHLMADPLRAASETTGQAISAAIERRPR